MASINESAHRASKSRRGRVLAFALGAAVCCGAVTGLAWGLASTFGAMHGAARTLSEAGTSLAMPLHPRVAATVEPDSERRVKIAKFARLGKPTESEIRRRQLTVAAIRMAHARSTAAQLARADEMRKAGEQKIAAAYALARRAVQAEEKLDGSPVLVTALAEDIPVRELPAFAVVLSKPEMEEDAALPIEVPLPEARPLIETVVADPAGDDDKPALRNGDDKAGKDAIDKPERSLFGKLFRNRKGDAGWPGTGTKVAIYDVSSATVYMPDGSRLRAHSGIGRMRDNPRYEHVTMRGPTPAGIYRLSMREKRFYGVEALRMTSIDGRHPKNRTGLLTHTNLLRGQIGSHGCVAFQNYQPFLRAFKRGHIKMLVVVPELPSSTTQLAALYRKAGA